jgi:hypothetical protein
MRSGPLRKRASVSFGRASTIVMTDGVRILTIPRHNPVNAFTMGGIVRDAGLTVEEFGVSVTAVRS